MKERAFGVAQLKQSGTRKLCADIDVLKTEEWKRRRLLRLEQVRQQSKDIANDVRRKVRLEKNSLTENFHQRTEVAATLWKEQKLTALQNELTQTLSSVGSAHKQAECESKQQEAKQQQKNHHLEAANRRGREALLHLRSDEIARKQAQEARKLQQQHVRSIEGARTAVVASLPAPESTVPVGNVPPVPKTKALIEGKEAESSCRQWPSKPWLVSIPLGVTPASVDDVDSNRTIKLAKSGVTQESKNYSSDYLSPNQCNGSAPVAAEGKHEIAGSDTSVKVISTKISINDSTRNVTALKTIQKPKEVELYDYTNGSHVQYVKTSAVSKSIPAGPFDGLEAAEACASNANAKNNALQTMSAKQIERGKKAVKRDQTRREYDALLSELAVRIRQQATLRSFLPEPEEPKKIQKKLNEAVIGILKETPAPNVMRRKFEPKKTEPEPTEAAPVSLKTCLEGNESIIDVFSQDETVLPESLDKRSLKEDTAKKEENLRSIGPGGDITEEEQKGVLTTPAKKSFQRETKEESFSANETSVGSDVPKLNLALWTSRSPGSSDFGDKTLTASEKQKKANSSGNTDPGDKTLTPSEEADDSLSSKRSSLSPAAPNSVTAGPGMKRAPSDRVSPTEKHSSQNEKVNLANQRNSTVKSTLNQRHLGSGDYVTVTSRKKQKSPELAPKTDEADTPRQEDVRRRSKKVSPSSSSTSYMSLPNKLLSAITEDLRSLLSLTRRRQNGDGPSCNPLLAHYINRLLDMSRQSVERLNVVTSEVPTPPSAVFRNGSCDSSRPSVSLPLNEAGKRSDLISSSTDTTKSSDMSSSSDSSELINVMRQCHARISSLSQMIERVRQEQVVSNRRSPSLHLDSTAYLSPPSSVRPSPQMLPRTTELPDRNNPLDDTYGAVITRLISEIRQQLAREAEKPVQISSTPPHGPAKNIKSSSSNELSTIPEQDSSSLEWSSVVISSETGGSSEDVEKEFSRMGLGWAGTTLRKTKEARTLDSNSSSDFLELSALSLFGNYSHSTPIKTVENELSHT